VRLLPLHRPASGIQVVFSYPASTLIIFVKISIIVPIYKFVIHEFIISFLLSLSGLKNPNISLSES